MDSLERRLRDDAALIRADVSPELDERIRASLEAVTVPARDRVRPERTHSLWWASSLTGLAAVLALVAILNLWPRAAHETHEPDGAPVTVAGAVVTPVPLPALRMRSAVLTAPLEEELDDLESDLAKARAAVRDDLGL